VAKPLSRLTPGGRVSRYYELRGSNEPNDHLPTNMWITNYDVQPKQNILSLLSWKVYSLRAWFDEWGSVPTYPIKPFQMVKCFMEVCRCSWTIYRDKLTFFLDKLTFLWSLYILVLSCYVFLTKFHGIILIWSQFLLAIHQQVTDAGHPRHMSHRLCAIEVLIDVLGHRVVHYSTCLWVFFPFHFLACHCCTT
jgi:hypothetical protein